MTANTLVVHSTQGSTIAGAVAAMRKHKSECHEVTEVTMVSWTSRLLVPFDQPARSLRHPKGTPETNNRGWTKATRHLGKVYQVELVGFAEQIPDRPEDWFEVLGRYLRPLCDRLDVPPVLPYPFVTDSTAYGLNARQRLTWDQWETVEGIVGHQHVPGNSHWDVDISRVSPYLQGAPMPIPKSPDQTWSMLDFLDCEYTTTRLYQIHGVDDYKGQERWFVAIAALLEQGKDPRPMLGFISFALRDPEGAKALAGG